MRTFTFTHKNTGNVFITKAENFEEADNTIYEVMHEIEGWVVDNEEGEDENALFI